jgi:hypothetical protein
MTQIASIANGREAGRSIGDAEGRPFGCRALGGFGCILGTVGIVSDDAEN